MTSDSVLKIYEITVTATSEENAMDLIGHYIFMHCREVSEKDYGRNYKKGFQILMEYWDSLPDEEKPKISQRLKEVGC